MNESNIIDGTRLNVQNILHGFVLMKNMYFVYMYQSLNLAQLPFNNIIFGNNSLKVRLYVHVHYITRVSRVSQKKSIFSSKCSFFLLLIRPIGFAF